MSASPPRSSSAVPNIGWGFPYLFVPHDWPAKKKPMTVIHSRNIQSGMQSIWMLLKKKRKGTKSETWIQRCETRWFVSSLHKKKKRKRKRAAVLRLAQPNGIKHAQTSLQSWSADEKCNREEEGTVNSLFRSQVLGRAGLKICFCSRFSNKRNVSNYGYWSVGSAQYMYLLIINKGVA